MSKKEERDDYSTPRGIGNVQGFVQCNIDFFSQLETQAKGASTPSVQEAYVIRNP